MSCREVMVAQCFFLTEVQLSNLLSGLADQRPFALVEQEADILYAPVSEETASQLALRSPRPVTSVKSLLFPARELVAVYGQEAKAGLPEEQATPGVIAGPRACEVEAIRILDQVFLEGDFEDPFYRARRDATTLITTDCVEIRESCHCNLVGGKPFADAGFDLNLSPVEGGYVVEVGSEKGQALLDGLGETRTATTNFPSLMPRWWPGPATQRPGGRRCARAWPVPPAPTSALPATASCSMTSWLVKGASSLSG
jgi:hypothetical protein